jgi:hypothetical protein
MAQVHRRAVSEAVRLKSLGWSRPQPSSDPRLKRTTSADQGGGAGQLLQIEVLDHVIGEALVSMKQLGWRLISA